MQCRTWRKKKKKNNLISPSLKKLVPADTTHAMLGGQCESPHAGTVLDNLDGFVTLYEEVQYVVHVGPVFVQGPTTHTMHHCDELAKRAGHGTRRLVYGTDHEEEV